MVAICYPKQSIQILTDFEFLYKVSRPNTNWANSKDYASVNSSSAHPPPGQTPGHLTFLKNFGQIPHGGDKQAVQIPHGH